MARKEIIHQTSATLPVLLIQFMIGLGYGWITPTLLQLKDPNGEFSLNPTQCSWIASLHHITKALGPVITAVLMDRIGRNRIFETIAGICVLMWIAVRYTRSVIALYIVRIAFGIALGTHETTLCIYIGENCSPKIRGVFNGIAGAAYLTGMLFAYTLATYLSYNHVASLLSGCGFATIITTLLLKEPAQYLIMKGKIKKAEKNYYWLQDSDDMSTKLEFEKMKDNVQQEKFKTSFTEQFGTPEARKSLRIVSILSFLAMSTGGPSIASYFTIAFSDSKHPTANELTILFGLIMLICTCISSTIMDKINRRSLWLMSSVATVIIHAATVALYCAHRKWNIPYFEWFLFALMTTYCSIYGMFLYPLSLVARGELLPQSLKAVGSGVGVITGSLSSFGTTKIFLLLQEVYGTEVNYGLYCGMGLLLLVYVYYDLPETKGKTLVEIQKELRTQEKTAVDIPEEYNKLVRESSLQHIIL